MADQPSPPTSSPPPFAVAFDWRTEPPRLHVNLAQIALEPTGFTLILGDVSSLRPRVNMDSREVAMAAIRGSFHVGHGDFLQMLHTLTEIWNQFATQVPGPAGVPLPIFVAQPSRSSDEQDLTEEPSRG